MKNKKSYREGIKRYLRENFKKPPIGFISKFLGEKSEYRHAITKIEPYKENNYFKVFTLLWVDIFETYLDKFTLPRVGSYGLFAVKDKTCLYLCKSKPENLVELLKTENNLFEIPPIILAKLFCDSNSNGWEKVIENHNDILEIVGHDHQIKENIKTTEATLIKNKNEYILQFQTLKGWKFAQNSVNHYVIKIKTEDFRFEISQEEIHKRIFSNMPSLRYLHKKAI